MAVRRILADQSFVGLGQIFVTVFYCFNEDYQKYIPPPNLIKPPPCNSENEESRIWSDFSFQPLGKADDFLALESMIENSQDGCQLLPPKDLTGHPYLSPEKAKQVNEWVVPATSMLDPSTNQSSDGVASRQLESPSHKPTGHTKTPGIKVRRPVQPPQLNSVSKTKSVSHEVVSSESQVEPSGKTVLTTPRKRWKMKYEPNLGSSDAAQASDTKVEKDIGDHKPLEKPVISNTSKPEDTSYVPIKSDSTKYALNRYPIKAIKPDIAHSKAEKGGRNKPMMEGKPAKKDNELIDVRTPVNATRLDHPPLLFNTPALIPEPSTSVAGIPEPTDASGKRSMTSVDACFADLAGLNIAGVTNVDGSASSVSMQDSSSSKSNFPEQDARLQRLKLAYNKHLPSTIAKGFVKPCKRRGDVNRLLEKQVIDDYERSQRPEAEQSVRETENRQYHHTMNQKAGKSGQKSKSKVASAAKKQATLEDAWGMSKQKKQLVSLETQNSSVKSDSMVLATAETEQKAKRNVGEDIERVFAAMKPMLQAAEAFPGMLVLEVQLGLVIIPFVPKAYDDKLISLNEWSKIFQLQSGLTAPSTKFVNRLTACGAEIDRIVDLKTSKSAGRSRLFRQEYSEYDICYEFHCRTNANELLIIAVDERGGYTIQTPKSTIGSVNMHFPRKVWDARAVVSVQNRRISPEVEETAKYLADHIWIPAEKSIRVHTALPKSSKIAIQKVFMKRWTRHQYCRPHESLGCEHNPSEGHDIFLQVMEVQDLFIGTVTQALSEIEYIRARYTRSEEMVCRGRIWYELSLVSPAIETILKTNMNLEVGERTEDWRGPDLFGNTAAFFTGQPPSPVATAIGSAGIAELCQVAREVVDKMDGVGACNRGPMSPDTQRFPAINSQGNKGWSHEDLESVKEVESVVARVNEGPMDVAVIKRERAVKEFW